MESSAYLNLLRSAVFAVTSMLKGDNSFKMPSASEAGMPSRFKAKLVNRFTLNILDSSVLENLGRTK